MEQPILHQVMDLVDQVFLESGAVCEREQPGTWNLVVVYYFGNGCGLAGCRDFRKRSLIVYLSEFSTYFTF